MAKQSGLGDNFYIDGYDLSNDIGALKAIRGGPKAMNVTGIDKSGFERIGGLRDGLIQCSVFLNDAAGHEHPVLSTLPNTDRNATYCRGTALGASAAFIVGKQPDYGWTRAADGAIDISVETMSNGSGLYWGSLLTAGKRTDTTPTSPGTGVDLTTVSTAFGWQAMLHVFSVTGTSVTVTLQDSADNSSFANLAGGAFTAVAAPGPGSQYLVSGGRTDTVRRYLRAITTGTFTNAVFAVAFCRNDVAVAL